MANRPQIIVEYYDSDEKIVEGVMIDASGKAKRFREKGYNVEDFKKQVRKKFGDKVDIVNKVKKNRDITFGMQTSEESESSSKPDSRFDTKDIREIMKNKFSD